MIHISVDIYIDGPSPENMLPLTQAIEARLSGESVTVARESYVIDRAEVAEFGEYTE